LVMSSNLIPQYLVLMLASAVKSIIRKNAKAVQAWQKSLDVFNELDESVDPKLREIWEDQERMAMEFRGEYLDVYNINKQKGEFLFSTG